MFRTVINGRHVLVMACYHHKLKTHLWIQTYRWGKVRTFLYNTDKSPSLFGDEACNVREHAELMRCSYFYNERIVFNNNTRNYGSHYIVPLSKKDIGLINLHYNEILIIKTVHFQTVFSIHTYLLLAAVLFSPVPGC